MAVARARRQSKPARTPAPAATVTDLLKRPMGPEDSNWAAFLVYHVTAFLLRHDLGKVYIPDGPFRLAEGPVRLPDVEFVSWARDRRPKHRGEIPAVAPDLAVEILSRSNTEREMERKLGEYFAAGVRLAWVVDPRRREARVDTSPAGPVVLTSADMPDGGDLLPGFRLPLAERPARPPGVGPFRSDRAGHPTPIHWNSRIEGDIPKTRRR